MAFVDSDSYDNIPSKMRSYDQYQIQYDGTTRSINNTELMQSMYEKVKELEANYMRDRKIHASSSDLDRKLVTEIAKRLDKLEEVFNRFLKDPNDEPLGSVAETFTPTLEQEWRALFDQFNIVYTDEQIDKLSQKYKIPSLKSDGLSKDEKKDLLNLPDIEKKKKRQKWVSTVLGPVELDDDTVDKMMQLEHKINKQTEKINDDRDFSSYWNFDNDGNKLMSDEMLIIQRQRNRDNPRDQIIKTTKSF